MEDWFVMFVTVNSDSYALDELFDMIWDLFNKIKDKFSFINKTETVYVIDEHSTLADLMLNSLNKIADMLEDDPLFFDEFCLCLNLIMDIESIIDNDLLDDGIYLITDTVINYYNLIYDKTDYVLSDNLDYYAKVYDDFLKFYNNRMNYFHKNISNVDSENEDLIQEVIKILW